MYEFLVILCLAGIGVLCVWIHLLSRLVDGMRSVLIDTQRVLEGDRHHVESRLRELEGEK